MKSPAEDDHLRQVEREIIQIEIGIMEQQMLLLGLRTRGLSTDAVERTLDQMEAKLAELWGRRAVLVQAVDPRFPSRELH